MGNLLTFSDLAHQLNYELDSFRRIYNRCRQKEAAAKDFPSLSATDNVPAEVENYMRLRFSVRGKSSTERLNAESLNSSAQEKMERLKSEISAAKSVIQNQSAGISQLNHGLENLRTQLQDQSTIASDYKAALLLQTSELFTVQTDLEKSNLELSQLKSDYEKISWRLNLPSRLDVINYMEMGLASYGLWVMLDFSGLMLSVLANCFYYDAQRTLKNANAWSSASFALFVTFILSIGFGFVHYNTFISSLKSDYNNHSTSLIIALTVSGLSFSALYQTRTKTTDNQ